jgi:hypothetical protein
MCRAPEIKRGKKRKNKKKKSKSTVDSWRTTNHQHIIVRERERQ